MPPTKNGMGAQFCSGPIDDLQWDYSNIPDSEVDACWWYEYGRESGRIQEAVKRLHFDHSPIARKVFELSMIPIPAGLFLKLEPFFPDIPWQRIPLLLRESVVNKLHETSKERDAHFIVQDLTGINDPKEIFSMVRPSALSKWLGLNRRKFLVEVDLDEDPEDAASSFQKWFRTAQKSIKGTHTMPTKTRRAELKALGSVRILRYLKRAGKSDEDAIEDFEKFTVYKSESGNPVYSNPRDWRKAKARVKEIVVALGINKRGGGARSGEPSAQ